MTKEQVTALAASLILKMHIESEKYLLEPFINGYVYDAEQIIKAAMDISDGFEYGVEEGA